MKILNLLLFAIVLFFGLHLLIKGDLVEVRNRKYLEEVQK